MGDLAAVAFVLVLVILAALWATRMYNKSKKPKAGRHVSIWATNPNEAPVCIGSADVEDPDFMDKIEMIRSEAYMKVAALNSGRKAKTWRLEEHTGE